MIKFNCENCGQKISVPEMRTGKKSKCPKCKAVLVIPLPSGNDHKDPVPNFQFEEKPVNNTAEADDSALFSYEQITGGTEEVPERKLLWFIDIWLYPLNLAGVIHLICLWLLVFLLCPLVMGFLGLGIEYIPIVYTLPIAYVLYYFTECIRDSATGHFRVPNYWMHPADSDKWDFISQLLIVLGNIAVCFCPASIYYIVTGQTDLIYWLLIACGSFFFPMALLAAVLFDSYNALNPILIIGSIFRTFFPYSGMVLLFYGGALLFIKINFLLYSLRLLPAVPFISRAFQLYLIFVAVGLLGRFYWKYREKLNWEV